MQDVEQAALIAEAFRYGSRFTCDHSRAIFFANQKEGPPQSAKEAALQHCLIWSDSTERLFDQRNAFLAGQADRLLCFDKAHRRFGKFRRQAMLSGPVQSLAIGRHRARFRAERFSFAAHQQQRHSASRAHAVVRGQPLDEVKAARHVCPGFGIGAAVYGALGGPLPGSDCGVDQIGRRQVLGDDFRLGGGNFGELLGHGLADRGVVLAAPRQQQ